MSIDPIEWNSLSRRRNELMGLAMIFIVLFHVYLPRTGHFFGLRRTGNVGVDMFFFLSGMGLWFAWNKMQAIGSGTTDTFWSKYGMFMKRRLIRIYPTWLVMASLYYVTDYIQGGGKSQSVTDLLGDIILNWDFWLHDELTFWYIPVILLFYFMAPFYMELIRKAPVYRWVPLLFVVWSVAVQWVTPVHDTVGHIEIFWSRIPIFLIGINIGECVRTKRTDNGSGIWLLLFITLLPLLININLEQYHYGRFPLFVGRMLFIPLTLGGCLLLSRWLDNLPECLLKGLAWIGTLSLEIYLIHAHFVLNHITPMRLGYWTSVCLCMAATLPLAWLLQKGIGTLVGIIENKKGMRQ